ncbi:phosphatase PAP2 family protein [Cellulomonas aerilata]|uniref:Phosphatidic acid phosphatase type 2/haloperoxidase domain-containing protein n=1 Tax=Cellulomonas aerilata TaxID=515326 RepID=A0A512DAR5_9CELL|nr:phosphatase PAP2 family protein [Cellulomonas aerilata]GEO33572.1 hypothetical protein CAE01nite_12970 [Cellulomonas aerilata]
MTPPPGRRPRLLLGGALAAGLGLPVALLALAVRAGTPALVQADDAAVRAGTDLTRSEPALRAALVGWQEALQPLWVNMAVLATCVWVGRRHGLAGRARWTAVTVLVGWGAEALLKLVVQRARPVVDDAVAHASGFSFPSGHAANTTSAGIALTVLIWPLLGPRARVAVPVAVGAVVALTAADRVLLGVHHPSDVVAGVLVGGAVAGASWVAFGDRAARSPAGRAVQAQ